MQFYASPAFLGVPRCWQENKPKPVKKKHCHTGACLKDKCILLSSRFIRQNLYGLLISTRGEFTHWLMPPLWGYCRWTVPVMLEPWELAPTQCQESSALTLSPVEFLLLLLFLLYLWYAFSSLSRAHTTALEMFLLCTQTHKDMPFFIYFDLTVSASSLHLPWSDHKILRNTNQPLISPLSSRVGALFTLLSKGICIFIYVYDHKCTQRLQPSLECSQPLWHEELPVCRACTTQSRWRSVSLSVSVLNRLFYRVTPSSVSTLCPPTPFSGPKPAVQELLLPLHLEQSTVTRHNN